MRPPVDGDEDERGLERDGHEGIRRHPVHLLADSRGQNGHARREHAERLAKRNGRIALEPCAELELAVRRRLVEGRSECLRRRDRAIDPDLELLRR